MKTLKTLVLLVVMQLGTGYIFAQSGADLFKQNCGACHSVGNGKLVGPDLKGVETRHPMPWLMKWIKSSQSLVNAKDKEAVKLFADNSMIPMPDQALTDDQIKIIIDYIKQGGGPVTVDNSATTPAVAISTDVNVVVPFNNGIDPLVLAGAPAVFADPVASNTPAESGGSYMPGGNWWLVYLSFISVVVITATVVVFGGVVKDKA